MAIAPGSPSIINHYMPPDNAVLMASNTSDFILKLSVRVFSRGKVMQLQGARAKMGNYFEVQ